MRIIQNTIINDVNTPAEPLPNDAKAVVFNGTEYVVYEDGDEIPLEPSYDE